MCFYLIQESKITPTHLMYSSGVSYFRKKEAKEIAAKLLCARESSSLVGHCAVV
jgi:hypothetical protein